MWNKTYQSKDNSGLNNAWSISYWCFVSWRNVFEDLSPITALSIGQNQLQCLSISTVKCTINGDRVKRQNLTISESYTKRNGCLNEQRSLTPWFMNKFNQPVGMPNMDKECILLIKILSIQNQTTPKLDLKTHYTKIENNNLAHLIVVDDGFWGYNVWPSKIICNENHRGKSIICTPQGKIEKILSEADKSRLSLL